jgi:hypothetical protein
VVFFFHIFLSQPSQTANGKVFHTCDLFVFPVNMDMELTEELATKVAGPRGQIILTFTNRVRLDFARTWAAHAARLQLTNYLVGATDAGALAGLQALKVPCFSMRTNLPGGEWDWGSPSFKSLGQHKVQLVHKALSWGLQLIITDTDALILRQPFEYMARWPEAGFLTTSDCLGNTTGSDNGGGLEDHGCLGQAFNIGFMFFNTSALPLVRAWLRSVSSNPRNTWDQASFNSLARIGLLRDNPSLSDRRLFRAFNAQVVGGILPLALFAGGHSHFVSRLAWRQGLDPYSVHTTFQYGGAPGKRHRLREAMLWDDAPAYYDPPGGVLTYTPDVPKSLAHERTPRAHVSLMLHQLRQLRVALALASSLGRILVLPPLTCAMDKYWAPLNSKGVIPGAYDWAMPLEHCPLDHLLNPAEIKPSVEVHAREHSFLRNPRVPAAFRSSRNVTLVNPHGGGVEARRLRLIGARVLHVANLAQIAEEVWQQQQQQQQQLPAGRRRGARHGESGGRGRRHQSKAEAHLPGSSGRENEGGGDGLLTGAEWRRFRQRFANVQGGWCCAPHGLKPKAAGFHLIRAPAAAQSLEQLHL